MIPWRCVTRLALVELPKQLRSPPAFDVDAKKRAAKVFKRVGHRFDLRVAVEGRIDPSWFISTVDDAEVIDLEYPAFPATRKFELRVEKAGKVDGMLAWINLWCLPEGECVDSRDSNTTARMPVWLPVFYPGIELRPGDRVSEVWTPSFSSDGAHPDYALLAEVHRDRSPPTTYELQLPDHARRYRCSEFHRHLFPGLGAPVGLNSAFLSLLVIRDPATVKSWAPTC
jgi:protein arginine N-methyltransferase 1